MPAPPAITFHTIDGDLFLRYRPIDPSWMEPKLDDEEEIKLRNTFHLTRERLVDVPNNEDLEYDELSFDFQIGQVHGEYSCFDPDVLGIGSTVCIHQDIQISHRTFISERNISIFKRIDKLVEVDNIYIGGANPDAIPESKFDELLNKFPSTGEMDAYAKARVSSVLTDYYHGMEKYEESYHRIVERQLGGRINTTGTIIVPAEIAKYEILFQRLQDMLQDENGFTEGQWQDQILEFILLLHPKYIAVFEEVPIRDVATGRPRSLDFMLLDTLGNVDVIEIKKPFDKCLISERQYRNNHVPLKELSGTIMQAEKYIYNMMKGGSRLEKYLNKKYESELPDNVCIRITNPKAILILGRDNNLTVEQRNDFELIRRKYKNVVDILTYDDLLARFSRILECLNSNLGPPKPI